MKIFFDTEFMDLGDRVVLVALGAVRQDGAEFYAENVDVVWSEASAWLLCNVKAQLTGPAWTLAGIREAFRIFANDVSQFWAWYGAYDWFLMCRLFNGFQNLPARWPHYFHDLETLRLFYPGTKLPNQDTGKHHALHDARWLKEAYDRCAPPLSVRGCRRPLAAGQWWTFCGETDMGQTAPALCRSCGGQYKLKEI